MSLKVYKGDNASRSYENTFFKEVAGSLSNYFAGEKKDGILIGFPKVEECPSLRPDCILITENRIVIIDFKNYDGTIELPSDFENGKWMKENGVEVKGGSKYKNPYDQLKNYRDLLSQTVPGVLKSQIACVVCFHHSVIILNDVPDKYAGWFAVTDGDQYIDAIRDEIEVTDFNKINIDLAHSYFSAPKYSKYVSIKQETDDAVKEAKKVLQEKSRMQHQIRAREIEANRLLKEAENNKKESSKLREEAERIKIEAETAQKEVEKASQFYNEKRHEKEIEFARAKQAEENHLAEEEKRKAAEEKRKTAETNLEFRLKEIKHERNIKILKSVVIILVSISIIVAIQIIHSIKVGEQEKQEKATQAELEEDYLNGRECLPIKRVADFVSKNVCVEYFAGDVKENNYYIYIEDNSQFLFQTVFAKKLNIITKEEAQKYSNKTLQVRGEIKKYKDIYEILPTSLDQITIKQ